MRIEVLTPCPSDRLAMLARAGERQRGLAAALQRAGRGETVHGMRHRRGAVAVSMRSRRRARRGAARGPRDEIGNRDRVRVAMMRMKRSVEVRGFLGERGHGSPSRAAERHPRGSAQEQAEEQTAHVHGLDIHSRMFSSRSRVLYTLGFTPSSLPIGRKTLPPYGLCLEFARSSGVRKLFPAC